MTYTTPFRPFYRDVQLDAKVWFGKYKGLRVHEIIDRDYKYIIWCMENLGEGFLVSSETFNYLLSKER